MLQKLVKCFVFTEAIRPKLTFSDPTKIRLNPTTRRLELAPLGIHPPTGKTLYSTEANLYAKVSATNPKALRKWCGFSATPHPALQQDQTSVGYKLNDGSSDYFWGGGGWIVAGVGDWNTEQVVAANIDSFPVTTQQVSLVVNLRTLDRFVTPYLEAVEVLMECEISYLRSLLVDTLIPSFKQNIRPTVRIALNAQGSNLVSLKDVENNPNIVQVSAVYDHDADPKHLINLYSAFDATSKVVTMTTSKARGVALWIEFVAEPEVYLNWPSQDYLEVEKLPAVVLDGFSMESRKKYARASVSNINTNTAFVRRNPYCVSIELRVSLMAEKNSTLLEMQDQALKHATANRLMVWQAVDELFDVRILSESNFTPRPNLSDIHQTEYTLRLENLFFWFKEGETLPLIETLNFSYLSPELEGGVRYQGH